MNEMQQPRFLPKVSLLDIAGSYLKIALSGFGGSLSAWAQRVVVEERKWLTDKEFLAALALCRILPGPNQVNFAIYVGKRLRGVAGVLAALAGLVVVPFLLVLALGMLYFHNQNLGKIQSALFGAASAGAGMSIAMGIKLAARQSYRGVTALITVATFAAIGWLRYPLIPVLLVLAPVSIFACRSEAKDAARKEARDNGGR